MTYSERRCTQSRFWWHEPFLGVSEVGSRDLRDESVPDKFLPDLGYLEPSKMHYIAIFELLGVENYEISIRLSKNISIPRLFNEESTVYDLK